VSIDPETLRQVASQAQLALDELRLLEAGQDLARTRAWAEELPRETLPEDRLPGDRSPGEGLPWEAAPSPLRDDQPVPVPAAPILAEAPAREGSAIVVPPVLPPEGA